MPLGCILGCQRTLHAIFASIFCEFHIMQILSGTCCTTNWKEVSHEFHTNFTWLLHNSHRRTSVAKALTPSPSTVRRRFKPHSQQHPEKGRLQQARSCSLSHPVSDSGPEPPAKFEPQPRRDCQMHVIPMPNCGTRETGYNRLQFERLFVCPHHRTLFAWKAPLPPREVGSKCILGSTREFECHHPKLGRRGCHPHHQLPLSPDHEGGFCCVVCAGECGFGFSLWLPPQ